MSHEDLPDTDDSSLAVLEAPSSLSKFDTATVTPTRARPHSARRTPIRKNTASAVDTETVSSRRKTLRDQFPNGISWPMTAWMTGMHLGAVAALWYFSWAGFALFVGLHFVTACLGITLGYHRLLTHGSLIVPRPVKYFFSLCGMLSAEGSPLMWVATHRKHHVHSDHEDDPHSPNDGFWWSHMLWFHPKESAEERRTLCERWAPDLYKDPVQRFFDRTFVWYPVLLGVILYAVGEYFFAQGMSWLLWGLCARMVFAYHSTWFVNSATHIWGYRNYQTTDRSRNLWWVALLSYGEGWHNNHHAHQRLARHGHRWWELDVTYLVIRALKAVGLAKKVQDKLPDAT